MIMKRYFLNKNISVRTGLWLGIGMLNYIFPAFAWSAPEQVNTINDLVSTYTRESVITNNNGFSDYTKRWLRNVKVKQNACDMSVQFDETFTFGKVGRQDIPNWQSQLDIISLDKVSSFRVAQMKGLNGESDSWDVIAFCTQNCSINRDGKSFRDYSFSNIQTINAANSLVTELTKLVNQCSPRAKPGEHAACELKANRFSRFILEDYLTNPEAKDLTSSLDFHFRFVRTERLTDEKSKTFDEVMADNEIIEKIEKDIVTNKGRYSPAELSNLARKVCE